MDLLHPDLNPYPYGFWTRGSNIHMGRIHGLSAGCGYRSPHFYPYPCSALGLMNSPATFQALMNELFKDMIAKGWLVIYMDDMLLFSKDSKIHKERTKQVLARLREHNLFLKPEKCYFDVNEVEFLGLIVKPDTLAMDPVKLQGIKDWPTPTSVKAVCSFVGFANFYRHFISNFSALTRPLHDLTRKDQP